MLLLYSYVRPYLDYIWIVALLTGIVSTFEHIWFD
jgi:hypothetical protein